MKNVAKTGFTLLANACNPPDFATAITPSTGNPTAVTKNPKIVIQVAFPAACPKKGGKIKFPAPKNSENNIKLTNNKSFLDKSFINNDPISFFINYIFSVKI